MLFSTIGQLPVFLWMTGAGLLVGALYTLASSMRRLLCAGFWLTLIVDALFGLGAALILTAALVMGNYGQLRLYELLGAALGFILYVLGPDPLIRRGAAFLRRRLRHILVAISNFRLIKVIFK